MLMIIDPKFAFVLKYRLLMHFFLLLLLFSQSGLSINISDGNVTIKAKRFEVSLGDEMLERLAFPVLIPADKKLLKSLPHD